MICHICCAVVHEHLWHLRPPGHFGSILTPELWPSSNQKGHVGTCLHCRSGSGPEGTCDEIQSLSPAAPDILTSAGAHLLFPPDLRVPESFRLLGPGPVRLTHGSGPQLRPPSPIQTCALKTHVTPTSAGCTRTRTRRLLDTQSGARTLERGYWRSIPAR